MSSQLQVARLNTVRDKFPRAFPLETIALEMRKGNATLADLHEDATARTLAETTVYARELLERRGAEAYAEIKQGMPQMMPGVTARGRQLDDVVALSGLVCLEWDNPEMDTDSAMAVLCQNPHVVMAWRSLSGKPKALIRVAHESTDGSPLSLENFRHAWVSADTLFQEIGETDPAACQPMQLQNICSDPDIHFHLDAVKLEWSIDEETYAERMPEAFGELRWELIKELGQEYLDAINEMEFDTNGVGRVRVPCPFGNHASDGWGSRGNATRIIRHADNDFTLQCFKCPKIKRYNETGHYRKRYAIDTEHVHTTSDMDTERAANKNAVVQWLQETETKKGKHLLVLGSAAGTGKTTTGIFTADGLLYIAKTTEEADNVFQALDAAEQDVVRHRSRQFNRGHTDINGNNDWESLPLGLGEHERPCNQNPDLCDLHAKRLGTTMFTCNPSACSSYTDCKESAYLSQAEKEKNTSKVIYAWGEDIACDDLLSERIKRLCSKDDILIVDEVNPLYLTQLRKIDRDMLYDLTERFRHPSTLTTDIYRTLKALLDILSIADTPETFISGVKKWIDGIEDINALDEKIEKYPIGVVFQESPKTAEHAQPFEACITYQNREETVPVVDFETAHDTPAFFIDSDTRIVTDTYQIRFVSIDFLWKVGLAAFDNPPRRHRKLLTDLKAFIEENTTLDTAPFTFSARSQSFDFHLKPTLNHHRAIYNTAADPDNLIGEAYRETNIHITRHTGTPAAWKSDSVFQIATGAYLPRQSLVRYSDDETLELKPRAQELVDGFIRPSITAGLKVLVVAPKVFQDIESVKEWAATEMDDFRQGHTALLINHHHAEGRNDYQDCDIVFVFHYEPHHSEIQNASKRIYRNPEIPLDFTRETRTVKVGSVSFEKTVYVDARVQAVYNRECRARLMQSGMRLRPNINPDKHIFFFTAEPVDIPVTPTAFTPRDAQHFTGDPSRFKEHLHAETTAIESGDVQAVVEIKGVSERHARELTQQPREVQKSKRESEILRLHRDGHTQLDIERQLKQAGFTKGTSPKTIRTVLKAAEGVGVTEVPLLVHTNSTISEMPTRVTTGLADTISENHSEEDQISLNCTLPEAIEKEEWERAATLLNIAITQQELDTWYDSPEMLECVEDAGYDCYTCFMKAKGVLPNDTVCFEEYGARAEKMRKEKCRHHPDPLDEKDEYGNTINYEAGNIVLKGGVLGYRPPFKPGQKWNVIPYIHQMYADGHDVQAICTELFNTPEFAPFESFVRQQIESQTF